MRSVVRLLLRIKRAVRQALGPRALAWEAAAGDVAAAGVAQAQIAASCAAIVADAQLHCGGAVSASVVEPP
jgi:hypothetical protein